MWRTVRVVRRGTVCGLLLAGASAAASEPGVVEELEHGHVDWTQRMVLATGSGAPDRKQSNVAKIRLAAERSARLDAYRKVLETLKGVRVTAESLGKSTLRRSEVRTQVEGIIRGCKTVDTRYYSDGGVDVVIRCPLDGGLASVLVPIKKRRALPMVGVAAYSGLIVDAVGTKVRPALSPRVVDPNGNVVYSADFVGPNSFREHGAARFSRTVEAARRHPRIGNKPLVVKALGLGDRPTDVQISTEDAAKLTEGNLAFLVEARVVITMDGP